MEDQPPTKADIEGLRADITALGTQLSTLLTALPNQIADALKERGRRREPRRVQHGANDAVQRRGMRREPRRAQHGANNHTCNFTNSISVAKEETKCFYPVVIEDMMSGVKEETTTPGEALEAPKNYDELSSDESSTDLPLMPDIQHELTPDESSNDLPLMLDIQHEMTPDESSNDLPPMPDTQHQNLISRSSFPDLLSLPENKVNQDMPMKTKVYKDGEYVMVFFDKIGFRVGMQNQWKFNSYGSFKTDSILYSYRNPKLKKPQPSNYGCPFQVEVIRYPEKNSRSSSSEVEETDAGAILAIFLFYFSSFTFMVLWCFSFSSFYIFLDFLIIWYFPYFCLGFPYIRSPR